MWPLAKAQSMQKASKIGGPGIGGRMPAEGHAATGEGRQKGFKRQFFNSR
jgi:hypothetical protein